jgi:hypothetical protein
MGDLRGVRTYQVDGTRIPYASADLWERRARRTQRAGKPRTRGRGTGIVHSSKHGRACEMCLAKTGLAYFRKPFSNSFMENYLDPLFRTYTTYFQTTFLIRPQMVIFTPFS